MTLEEIQQQHDGALMATYGRFPVALEQGKGAVATDVDGRQYIDFGSGIGVNSLGYCDDGWVKAVSEQAARLQHVSNLYYQPVQVDFAAELCAATGMSRVFLANSGAEANECAIKLARKYSRDTYGDDRYEIITLRQSFHGRTMATLTATGQDALHVSFDPFIPGFAYVPAGDIEALRQAISARTCAVMLECIQGEGGVIAQDPAYLQAVEALCREHDLLLIVDEVQTGAGRTGKLLASENAGIHPDVVTMAKGLGGGLPIGACLCNEKCKDVMQPGSHGSTFGGNPVVCAGARYVLSRLTAPGFLDEVAQKGAYMREKIAAMPHVCAVRGQGMMIGILLDEGLQARTVAEQCLQNGLLILTAKTLLRLLPPLTISYEEIDRGLAILQKVLEGAN
jgi:acetylornithine/N-succinyldiaminopimelate aminotransferase